MIVLTPYCKSIARLNSFPLQQRVSDAELIERIAKTRHSGFDTVATYDRRKHGRHIGCTYEGSNGCTYVGSNQDANWNDQTISGIDLQFICKSLRIRCRAGKTIRLRNLLSLCPG
jgi:hypothetical protein